MQVIYCRNHHPLSFLIRAFTWSRWSHCGVVIGQDVIHATAKHGVIRQSLAEVQRQYPSHEMRFMPGDARTALQYLGAGYDWGGVFGVRWGLWNQPDKWFCSELVAQCSGLFNNSRISRVTPEHCYMVSQ
ncbi:hypothetical protein [Bowmanella denitrificans]|uniref:hypothetical protein n=1 Tax=Bowmanella denitrificans TaxID=366582 RepID=UPI000C9BB4D8|nr:hypothetical protein [Bowmanella denitrificans]